ncbi:hypothetical protein QJS04_geneDACA011308 [Acorus gramineus]|uniref:Uncharacterized protein n=1 Tax=Acorus gramineus TaxID=55184 RepID=A0AAV9AJI0_ACOGR|nr:hypothetical protein QJS04_geneDACA011308 [Acorus gramineus]
MKLNAVIPLDYTLFWNDTRLHEVDIREGGIKGVSGEEVDEVQRRGHQARRGGGDCRCREGLWGIM